MAIIVEEGEKRGNIFGIVEWVAFLIIAGIAIYYVFFSQPELVIIPATGNIGAVAPIAQVSLHPETILQGAAFQALTSTIALPTPQGPAQVGRTNPFVSP